MSPVRPTVTVVGRRHEPEDHRLRDLLTRIAQPYDWHDADAPDGVALLERHGAGDRDLPLLVDEGEALTDRKSVV